MGGSQYWKFRMLALLLAPVILAAPAAAQVPVPKVHFPPGSGGGKVIILGFVGGFVSQDDAKHPAVQFATYLRDRYQLIEAVVFRNHYGKKALHEVVRMLDSDGDGVLTPDGKRESTIICLRAQLGCCGDSYFRPRTRANGDSRRAPNPNRYDCKPSSRGVIIPVNVAGAINFYQTRCPLHGLSESVAADPKQTKILGDILMAYEWRPIDCANYSWCARVFNRPHHEI
jgi:hypothetical protein